MKCAILFCGRVKSFEKCLPSINKYILDELKNKNISFDSFLSHNSKNNLDNINEFNKIFNVKSYESIETYNIFDISIYKDIPIDIAKAGNIKSLYMFYHLKKSFELMEEYMIDNKILYDIVLYMRADMIVKSPIIISNHIKLNSIFIPDIYHWYGYNDQFAYGNLDTMKKYCEIIDNIFKIYELKKDKFHSETYNKLNIEYNKLDVNLFPMNYELHKDRKYI